VRLALSLPFMALATLIAARDLASGSNVRLEQSGSVIAWGSRDLGNFIGVLYPPIPIAIASILPGGAAMLGFVGALAAGVMLHVAWERLRLREVPGWLIVVLLVTFGATPAFAYLSTQDLSGFIGLGLFTLAVSGFLRFATDGDTEGGFMCGLALGVAVACDPVALIYTVCLSLAAAPVAWQRYRGETHAVRASALVIGFPAVGAVLGWTFLQWRFTGSAFGWLTDAPGTFDFPEGVWGGLADSFRRGAIGLLISPLFLLTQSLLIWRRREAVLVAVLPVVGLSVSLWLGLRTASGHTIVLLSLLALMSVPRKPSKLMASLIASTAVLGFALVFYRITSTDNVLHEWLSAVAG
jgi:hypothetical protein